MTQEMYPTGNNFKEPYVHWDTEFNNFFLNMLNYRFLPLLRIRRDIYPQGVGINGTTPLFLIAETQDPNVVQALRPHSYLPQNKGGWFELGMVDDWHRFEQNFIAPPNATPAWMDEDRFARILGERGFQFDRGYYVHPTYPPNGLILPPLQSRR